MERKTLDVGAELTLHIVNVPGDLRLTGWERAQIKAKTNGVQLDLDVDGDSATLSCDNDLIVSVPRYATIKVDNVAGDASLRVLDGALSMQQVGGDLALRNLAEVVLESVGGDLVLRHASGAFQLKTLGGDASLRDVHGAVTLNQVGGDLHIRDLKDAFQAAVGGDVIANIQPQGDAAYKLQAAGDVLLRLPADVDATLSLSAAGDLDVNLPGVDADEGNASALVLGSGAAAMSISAGGDLLVTSRTDEWAERADFDISLPFIGADFPGLPDDFAETISQKAEEAARKAEKAARKVEEKIRRSEHKYRNAERQAVRAARHAERQIRFGRVPTPPKPPKAPRRPEPPSEPVSDAERLLILKMLEEKKITAAEAEKLLAVMEA